MVDPETALVACRILVFAGALAAWGGAAFRWRVHAGAARMPFEAWAVAALALATIVLLPVQVARLAGDWEAVLDGETVWAVLSATTNGQAWAVQAAATALVLVGFAKGWTRGLLAATGLVLAAQSMTGHAASSDGAAGLLRQANDVAHLMAAGAWLGALPYVLRLLKRLHEPGTRDVLIRYSGEGHLWVSLVLVTGLVATVWIFGGIPLDLTVRYQFLWWLKVGVSAAMVLLAVRNRYILVPRLPDGPAALAAIARATKAEIALGLLAVALVAWFGTLEPG